jgi:hypothetical protein
MRCGVRACACVRAAGVPISHLAAIARAQAACLRAKCWGVDIGSAMYLDRNAILESRFFPDNKIF